MRTLRPGTRPMCSRPANTRTSKQSSSGGGRKSSPCTGSSSTQMCCSPPPIIQKARQRSCSTPHAVLGTSLLAPTQLRKRGAISPSNTLTAKHAWTRYSCGSPLQRSRDRRRFRFVCLKKDQPIFLAGRAAKATHLLTGDLKHFGPAMNKPHLSDGIVIQTVAEFLSSL